MSAPQARRAPVLFLSHGAPDLALRDAPAPRAWQALGQALPDLRAVVVVTAHWTTTEGIAVEIGPKPPILYDFGGFGPELERCVYPAPGEPALAARIIGLLRAAGLPAEGRVRGFDHGVWVPLLRMRPAADLPVIALSVQPRQDAAWHLAVGAALAPLREEGILILGSGAVTHRLEAAHPGGSVPPPWVTAFDDWVVAQAATGAAAGWSRWTTAPEARRNHPTPEHFLPLLVAAGAGQGPAEVVHRGTTWGVLAMTCLRWQDPPT